MTFRVYRDRRGEWRWQLRTRNGRTIADSAEGYDRKEGCKRAIAAVKKCAVARVVDREE